MKISHLGLSASKLKIPARILLQLINMLNKVAEYNINAQKSMPSLYTKDKKRLRKKVKEIVSLTIASKVSLNNSYQVGEIPYYKNFKTPDGGSTCF